MNNILDYEQVLDELKNISSKGVIKEEKDLAITEHDLPIKYYTVGSGTLDVVVSGATHGQEIITTDFVLKLMEDITNNPDKWNMILSEFKIHFVPMLNPEGYLITTSAVRKKLPRDMNEDEVQKLCIEYYRLCKEDSLDNEISKDKCHLKFFEGVDYNCIPDKYSSLKEKVKSIFDKYDDLPKNCLHIWSANGNGIDIQANSEFNPVISRILNNEEVFMSVKRFDNIMMSHPGPINCPLDKEVGFKTEIETKAIASLLERLNKNDSLFAYLNYHSTGAIIFNRPAEAPEELNLDENELLKKEVVNYMLAKAYSSKTYKNTGIDEFGEDRKNTTNYKIMKNKSQATSSNDIFRLLYSQNILVELSALGGNPIAPYANIDNLYDNMISSNLDAVNYSLKVSSLAKKISEYFFEKIKDFKDYDYEDVIKLEDMIFDEFDKKILELENKKGKVK